MFGLTRFTSSGPVATGVKLKLYGLVMLTVIGLFISVTVAIYNDVFKRVVPVTLKVERAGLQMNLHADVKIRGVIVGQVTEISSHGRHAVLDLAFDPQRVTQVPADVKARLIPKTLFGEKYVSLVVPDEPAPRHLRAGDLIEPDRSKAALELQQLFDDVLPMLRAVQPAKLNASLNAIASTLQGRGEQLGSNLVRLRDYLRELNGELPQLKRNITLLADFAETYSAAAPDLVRTLRNFTVAGNTVIEKRQTLDAFLGEVTLFADTGREVLAANEERIVRLNSVSVPVLDLLAEYSPQYPCLLAGFARADKRLSEAFGGGQPGLHITLEVVQPREAYEYPEDLPENGSAQERLRQMQRLSGYDVERGPHCYGLPDPQVPFPTPEEFNAAGMGEPIASDTSQESTSHGRALSAALTDASMGYAGTAAEQQLINHLVGPVMNRPPQRVPDVATLLFGPMARGTAVSVE